MASVYSDGPGERVSRRHTHPKDQRLADTGKLGDRYLLVFIADPHGVRPHKPTYRRTAGSIRPFQLRAARTEEELARPAGDVHRSELFAFNTRTRTGTAPSSSSLPPPPHSRSGFGGTVPAGSRKGSGKNNGSLVRVVVAYMRRSLAGRPAGLARPSPISKLLATECDTRVESERANEGGLSRVVSRDPAARIARGQRAPADLQGEGRRAGKRSFTSR